MDNTVSNTTTPVSLLTAEDRETIERNKQAAQEWRNRINGGLLDSMRVDYPEASYELVKSLIRRAEYQQRDVIEVCREYLCDVLIWSELTSEK